MKEKKAAESRESASELSAATTSLTDKLRETKGRLATKEEIAANDGESAHNALEKANQAQGSWVFVNDQLVSAADIAGMNLDAGSRIRLMPGLVGGRAC